MSPEVILKCYDYKCDIWSIGIILFTLLNKEFPYTGNNLKNIKENIFSKKKNYPIFQNGN